LIISNYSLKRNNFDTFLYKNISSNKIIYNKFEVIKMNRKKDHDSYVKFLAVIDTIINNSDENNPITIKEIQNLIIQKGFDFKIDYRIVKKFVENYNYFYNNTVIRSCKIGRNNYFYN
jgi:hypothetical protein